MGDIEYWIKEKNKQWKKEKQIEKYVWGMIGMCIGMVIMVIVYWWSYLSK